MPPSPSRVPFRGWRMVAVAFLVDFIAVGFFFYSFGVFYRYIDEDFAGASVWVAMGISVSNLLSGVFAPFIGRALDRHPIRNIMLLGAAIVSAGFALLSRTTVIWQYYLVLGTFFAFGIGMMGGMASSKLVANWFIVRRGTALGVATIGVSFSGMVMPAVAHWLISQVGWRHGFEIYAVGILALVVPVVALLVVTRPEDIGQRPDGEDPEAPAPEIVEPERIWSTGEILRSPKFWIIALPFAAVFSSLSAVLIHVVPYAHDLGVTGYWAAAVLQICAAAGVIGKVVFGRMVDRFDPRVAVGASFGTQIVGLALLLLATGPAGLVAAGLVFGFGMGGVVPLQGAVCGAAFGRLSFGSVMGLMRPVQVPLHAVGIPLAAWIHDASGSFHPAFWIFLIVYAVSSASIAALRVSGRGGTPQAVEMSPASPSA